MYHPDPPVVIVVNDSDQEDCGGSQSDTSSVSLVDSTASILSPGSATSRRGKSRLMLCARPPTTDAGIRQRPTRSQLHEVIVIDSDDSPHKPLVRL